MAVIIEDMKMPEGCTYCELSYIESLEAEDEDHVYCSYTGDCVDGFYKERANNCPLKEMNLLKDNVPHCSSCLRWNQYRSYCMHHLAFANVDDCCPDYINKCNCTEGDEE